MDDASPRSDQRFPKSERLRHRQEFVRAQRQGRRHQTPRLTILSLPSPTGQTRLGVTVSRKVGNAVTRARVKRRLREVFRCNKPVWPAATDIVVIAREPASTAPFSVLTADLLGWAEKQTARMVR